MGVIQNYAELLPVTDKTPRITLGEGSTPLVHLDRISSEMEIDLWGKLEGCNPSGSFKDRGMVMAVAKALESGAQALVCARAWGWVCAFARGRAITRRGRQAQNLVVIKFFFKVFAVCKEVKELEVLFSGLVFFSIFISVFKSMLASTSTFYLNEISRRENRAHQCKI